MQKKIFFLNFSEKYEIYSSSKNILKSFFLFLSCLYFWKSKKNLFCFIIFYITVSRIFQKSPFSHFYIRCLDQLVFRNVYYFRRKLICKLKKFENSNFSVPIKSAKKKLLFHKKYIFLKIISESYVLLLFFSKFKKKFFVIFSFYITVSQIFQNSFFLFFTIRRFDFFVFKISTNVFL